ncbi:hypothetical protein IB292_02985 [Vibrio parahaemolyticus]|uniref:Uncharacterized protein n=1 Tax=Vibrio parahaemolyticus TaxID=670 RepID=A0A9Q3YG70_VIBPH|nr:hypothetical protein [Vibrio parahaemolyticus]MCC3803996.1 hypothetical protein [Vibrio parahaemolyticus]
MTQSNQEALTVHNVSPQKLKQAVENGQIGDHEAVSEISKLLLQHYSEGPDSILNYLLIRESILSIHGQTRNDLASSYAIELLEKAKRNELQLTFNDQSRFSALQFELPRKD